MVVRFFFPPPFPPPIPLPFLPAYPLLLLPLPLPLLLARQGASPLCSAISWSGYRHPERGRAGMLRVPRASPPLWSGRATWGSWRGRHWRWCAGGEGGRNDGADVAGGPRDAAAAAAAAAVAKEVDRRGGLEVGCRHHLGIGIVVAAGAGAAAAAESRTRAQEAFH